MATISLSPLTRIEGHLAVHTESEPLPDGTHRVTDAHCEGEMFRGFEQILHGRDPLDAQQITQRICGVCPIAHGIASIKAQEMAYGIKPTANGRILQNLIFAANYLQSHILHFYHLAALDFVDITAVLQYTGRDRTLRQLKQWVEASLANNDVFPAAPFLPRYEADYIADADVNCELVSHYVEALDIRTIAHEMCAVFAAKMPHSTAIVPGGCTQEVTVERILSYRSRLKTIEEFVANVYVPDLVTAAGAFPQYWDVGAGPGDMLSYGAFELADDSRFFPAGVLLGGKWEELDPAHIAEFVGHSRFNSGTGLHPYEGTTRPDPGKSGAYSWLKAPRYKGRAVEVGPLARVATGYFNPYVPWIKERVDAVIAPLGLTPDKLFSVLGRHVARGLECIWLAEQCHRWLDELEIGGATAAPFEIPATGRGYGLTEAPRGALGHWLTLKDHHIDSYQCIVPTTWNCSPRDDEGTPGPVEAALEGVVVANREQPIEVGRVVRSFDPCLACAVH